MHEGVHIILCLQQQPAGQRIRGPKQWENFQRVTVNWRHGKIVGIGGFQVRFDCAPRSGVNPWYPVKDYYMVYLSLLS